MSEKTTQAESDYYAVYIQRTPKGRAHFWCHVETRHGKEGAVRVARRQSGRMPKRAFAVRIGREGYYRALAQEFRLNGWPVKNS